ncbi:hypothetical protein Efla_003668 [Eimeria flavescens]
MESSAFQAAEKKPLGASPVQSARAEESVRLAVAELSSATLNKMLDGQPEAVERIVEQIISLKRGSPKERQQRAVPSLQSSLLKPHDPQESSGSEGNKAALREVPKGPVRLGYSEASSLSYRAANGQSLKAASGGRSAGQDRRERRSSSKTALQSISRQDREDSPSSSPKRMHEAADRAGVLQSIANFELNLQRQGASSAGPGVEGQSCCLASREVEEVLLTMRKKLPSAETQLDFNARLLERLHENRRAQEAACFERSTRRHRVLLEQAQKCKEALEARVAEAVGKASSRRSPQCAKLVAAVARARQYEKVIRCNMEVQKTLLKEQEKKLTDTQKRHEQLASKASTVLNEAAIQEQSRIYRSAQAIRRTLKRSKLIEECEAMAYQIVNMVLEASDYKEKFNTTTIPLKVWRGWLERFVAFEQAEDSAKAQQTSDATPPAGVIINLPVTPPSFSTAEAHQNGQLSPLPVAFINEMRDYVNAEGGWCVAASELSGHPGIPPLPPLTDFLANLLQPQERLPPSLGVTSQEQPTPATAVAKVLEDACTDMPCIDNEPKSNLLQEPQLQGLGRFVNLLLQQARPDQTPPKPPGVPDVLLRIIITGKPESGKHALAKQLAARYKLELLSLPTILQEALHAHASLKDKGASGQSEAAESAGDEESSSLGGGKSDFAALGAEASQYLAAGDPLPDALAIKLLVAKLQSVFPADNQEKTESQLRRLCAPDSEDQAAPRSSSGSNSKNSSSAKRTKGGKSPSSDRAGGPYQETAAAAADSARCGWILVGFPVTVQQYAMLEERLSGYVEDGRKQQQRLQALKERSDLLTLHEGCADLHVLVDIPIEEILRGAAASEEGAARAGSPALQPLLSQQKEAEAKPLVGLLDLAFAFEAHQGFVEEFARAFGSGEAPRLMRVTTTDIVEAFASVAGRIDRVLNSKLAVAKANELHNASSTASGDSRGGVLQAAQGNAAPPGVEGEQTLGEEAAEEGHQQTQRAESPNSNEEAATAQAAAAEGLASDEPLLAARLQQVGAEMTEFLASQWETLVFGYLRSMAQVLSWIQQTDMSFNAALVSLQCHFASVLKNAESLDGFITKYIQQYNEAVDTLGSSMKLDSIKGELHVRIDDFAEALWHQEERARQQAATERKQLLEAGWVDAFAELVAAQLAMILEAEVARYWALEEFAVDCFHTLLGLPLPDRQTQKAAEAESSLHELKGVAIKEANAALPAVWKSEATAAASQPAWRLHPFEAVEALAAKALLPIDFIETSTSHAASDEKKKLKLKDSPTGGGAARARESRHRAEPQQQQQVPEQQELDVLRLELQTQLLYRVRKACLWASACLLKRGSAASSLAARLEDWSVAHSMARQEAIGELAKRLREAVEEERQVKEILSIKGVQLLISLPQEETEEAPHAVCLPPPGVASSSAASPALPVQTGERMQPQTDSSHLLKQMTNDLLVASSGGLLLPTICLEEVLRGLLFAPPPFKRQTLAAPVCRFLPPLRLPGGFVDCVEFLTALVLKRAGPPTRMQLKAMRRAISFLPRQQLSSSSSRCLLDLLVTAEDFEEICKGRWPPLSPLSTGDVAERGRLPLRKLLSYLCLSSEPSRSLQRLSLFLPFESEAPPGSSACSGSSPPAAAEEMDFSAASANLTDLYALCCGLGFRGPLWGPPPLTLLPFAEFAAAAKEQQLLVHSNSDQQQQQKDLPSAGVAATQQQQQKDLPSAGVAATQQQQQQEQEREQQVLLQPFFKSTLFGRVVAACGAVYVRSPLEEYLSSVGFGAFARMRRQTENREANRTTEQSDSHTHRCVQGVATC